MKVEKIESIQAGNPFLSDEYNMGTYLGTNTCVMYANHPDKHCRYLIVVDTRTGERIKIVFDN